MVLHSDWSAWCGASQSGVGGEGVLFPLLIPLLNPSIGADSLEVLGEEIAGLILITLQLPAAVKVNIVLPAVLGNTAKGIMNPGSSQVYYSALLNWYHNQPESH